MEAKKGENNPKLFMRNLWNLIKTEMFKYHRILNYWNITIF